MAKGSIFGALEGSRLDLDYEQCLDRCVALWNASGTRDMFSPWSWLMGARVESWPCPNLLVRCVCVTCVS